MCSSLRTLGRGRGEDDGDPVQSRATPGADEQGQAGGIAEGHLRQVDDHRSGAVLQYGQDAIAECRRGADVEFSAYRDDGMAGQPAGGQPVPRGVVGHR